MMFTMKMVVAAVCWTAALGAALGRTFGGYGALTVWAILAATCAACATATIVVDYVAERTAKYIVHQVAAEREATVRQAVKAMQQANTGLADRIVSRLADKQDKTLNQLGAELAAALRDDMREPTRIR